MKKKKVIIVTMTIILLIVISYFGFQLVNQNQDIEDAIEQELYELKHTVEDIYAIEFLDDDRVLVFYSWSFPDYSNFGVMELEKTWRGWQFVEAVSNRMEMKNAWLKGVYVKIGDRAILRGPTWASVAKIEIITGDGREYRPEIGKAERNIWYLILDDAPFEEATFILYDNDGEVLHEEVLEFDLNWPE
ncbi:hypothetical protein [Amphibacillus cookii]|uniref:hypothetical protein n=1 Tax=Amphibacillus cookii TaxID=767787 RepID=UPI0019582353|nr:hypothetical protein [Amphibacillus cookii]